jgi:hypothetical protein
VVVEVLVDFLVMVTFASVTAAPFGSVIRPRTLPVVTWACVIEKQARASTATQSADMSFRELCITNLPCLVSRSVGGGFLVFAKKPVPFMEHAWDRDGDHRREVATNVPARTKEDEVNTSHVEV